jgi:hypothetical protein
MSECILNTPFTIHTGKQHLDVGQAGEGFFQFSALGADLVKKTGFGKVFK